MNKNQYKRNFKKLVNVKKQHVHTEFHKAHSNHSKITQPSMRNVDAEYDQAECGQQAHKHHLLLTLSLAEPSVTGDKGDSVETQANVSPALSSDILPIS